MNNALRVGYEHLMSQGNYRRASMLRTLRWMATNKATRERNAARHATRRSVPAMTPREFHGVYTAFVNAIKDGRVADVRSMIQRHPVLLRTRDSKSGDTVVHVACQYTQPRILELVLSTKDGQALVSTPNAKGQTPLTVVANVHSVYWMEIKACMTILLAHGAKPTCEDVVVLLGRYRRLNRSELTSYAAAMRALMASVSNAMLTRCRILPMAVELWYSIDYYDNRYDNTLRPLLYAMIDRSTVDQKNAALFHATPYSARIAKKLLESGANANARNENGETPLFATTRDDIIRILLQHGADINARDKRGRTALQHHITDEEFLKLPDLVTQFLNNGANPNARDNNGDTALHTLMRTSRNVDPYEFHGDNVDELYESAKRLVVRGAKPWLLNKQGQRPYDVFVESDARIRRLLDVKPRRSARLQKRKK